MNAARGQSFHNSKEQPVSLDTVDNLSEWALKMNQEKYVSRFMDVTKVAALLVSEHGKVPAQKHAMAELRKARRARSRKRFNYWFAVASQLAAQPGVTTANTASRRVALGRPQRGTASTPMRAGTGSTAFFLSDAG
jgi:hypothetical protein